MLDRVQSKNHHFCQFNRECKTLKLGHDSLARHLLATSKMSDQRREWALNIILDPSADFKFNRIDLFCSITQFQAVKSKSVQSSFLMAGSKQFFLNPANQIEARLQKESSFFPDLIHFINRLIRASFPLDQQLCQLHSHRSGKNGNNPLISLTCS